MSYSPYGWNVYQFELAPSEESLSRAGESDNSGDHPPERIGLYQQTSDDEGYFHLCRIVEDYEFQERGGILPEDCVLVEAAPGQWECSVVLLVGTETLIVVCPNSESRNYPLAASLASAIWIGEHY